MRSFDIFRSYSPNHLQLPELSLLFKPVALYNLRRADFSTIFLRSGFFFTIEFFYTMYTIGIRSENVPTIVTRSEPRSSYDRAQAHYDRPCIASIVSQSCLFESIVIRPIRRRAPIVCRSISPHYDRMTIVLCTLRSSYDRLTIEPPPRNDRVPIDLSTPRSYDDRPLHITIAIRSSDDRTAASQRSCADRPLHTTIV